MDIEFDIVISGDAAQRKELVANRWLHGCPKRAVIDRALLRDVFKGYADGPTDDELIEREKVELQKACDAKFFAAQGDISFPIRLAREDFPDW